MTTTTRTRTRVREVRRALVCLAAVAVLGGCVTERTPVRGGGGGGGASTKARAGDDRAGVTLDGPIARPAYESRTVNARMLAAVTPIGSVPFDGQVLPLVSPDGRWVATEVGEAPTWGALLGEVGAGPTLRTRIEVWDAGGSPARRVNLRSPLRGVMLGRGCDGDGFLVEENMPDGSRRIGRASWETGEVRWLVDDGRVNAFGEMLGDGRLAWSARDVEGGAFELVVDGRPAARGEGVSYLFPMAGGDVVYVLAASERGLEVQARSMRSGRIGGGGAEDGSYVVARRRLTGSGEAVVAYQAAASARGRVVGTEGGAPGLLLFHPGAGRMVVVDPERGQVVALAEGSIAGVWSSSEDGWAALVTTPRGLEHQWVILEEGLWEALPSARSLGDPHVARATTAGGRRFVLLGPDPGDARRVRVMGLELLTE